MMVQSRRIKMFVFVIFLLQFPGALSADLFLSVTVRDGDEVTLPCGNVIRNHQNCDTTTWIFSDSRRTPAVTLAELGQIKETAKSDRLSVTADCSLIIKKVTDEDVGSYTCRQFRRESERQEGPDAVVHLSVVINTSSSSSSSSSTTTMTTILDGQQDGPVWPYILAAVILVALLIIAVILMRLKRLRANKTKGNAGLNSNPAVTQCTSETTQETVEPEDGVSYASISYTKNPHSGNKVIYDQQGKHDDDEGGTVTYSTVKAASTEPSSLYATIK